MNKTILAVEDDVDLAEFIQELLSDFGFIVQTANDGAEALRTFKKIKPSLVLLDLQLPDINGEEVCKRMKQEDPDVPVIMLTAKDDTKDVVKGLEYGADDYITKPFAGEVLVARINARLRHGGGGKKTLEVADLTLNTETMEVKRGEKLISLTPTEYKLLHYLMTNQNQVLTREMILSHVWAYSPDIESRVVDVYVGYLRNKIDQENDKKLIHSIRGFGYTIKEVASN